MYALISNKPIQDPDRIKEILEANFQFQEFKLVKTSAEFMDVGDFHEKFGLIGPSEPSFLNDETLDFRVRFMVEELQEFLNSYGSKYELQLIPRPRDVSNKPKDMHGAADALVDLVYVILGTAHLKGLPWYRLWMEVQRANMEKRRAESADESKRGSTLDVMKPAGWKAPDHTAALGEGPWKQL